MYRKRVILYAVALLALAGCSRYKDVSLDHIAIEQFNMTSLSTARVKIQATLNNPAGNKITVTELDGVLKIKEKTVAVFNLDSSLVFDAKSVSTREGTLQLKIQDMSVLFSGVIELDESLLDQLRLDIDASVKSRGVRRKLQLHDIPAKNFLNL
ncbi:MAG: lipoprotein [Bacteroidales bacterium]|jgi:LEA14-like dessication related protein|nr:lipoprotein [Bacteroidales bacterium]NLK80303.1 lipoprotein [Bacteroidales bacterium]HKM31613.1 lipoprotein [Bacteroidales bacterium]HPX79373.1 lipoprotein [Bacteroidales bacterium]